MKQLLTIFFLLSSFAVFSQNQKPVDSLSFCLIKFKVPTGAKADSEYEVQGSNYSMLWLYMNPQMMEANVPEQFISQMEGKMKKFKKEAIPVFLLDKEVKGYKISFKTDTGTGHQVVAYGVANGQPVLVQLSLQNEPKSNSDIPDFPRQILKLTK